MDIVWELYIFQVKIVLLLWMTCLLLRHCLLHMFFWILKTLAPCVFLHSFDLSKVLPVARGDGN